MDSDNNISDESEEYDDLLDEPEYGNIKAMIGEYLKNESIQDEQEKKLRDY